MCRQTNLQQLWRQKFCRCRPKAAEQLSSIYDREEYRCPKINFAQNFPKWGISTQSLHLSTKNLGTERSSERPKLKAGEQLPTLSMSNVMSNVNSVIIISYLVLSEEDIERHVLLHAHLEVETLPHATLAGLRQLGRFQWLVVGRVEKLPQKLPTIGHTGKYKPLHRGQHDMYS